ncbi:MAG: phosphatase PAP2 family protein [Bacteroidales bacterium]|jgi:undecaprenyl-diphosphatase
MFDQLIELDRSIFLTLNGFHSPFFDQVMIIFSARTPWIALYLSIALYMFFSFKWEVPDGPLKPKFRIIRKPVSLAYLALAGAIVTFAFTDILSSQIKDLAERPRPAYDPVIASFVRMLEYKGGMYGFLSNHAANVFGLATFTSLIFKRKYYSVSIFIWAFMVSYSRIYVGKHFPLDVLCGAVLGLLTGWCIFLVVNHFVKRFNITSCKSDVLHS